jgi:hypothetical protein
MKLFEKKDQKRERRVSGARMRWAGRLAIYYG